MPKNDRTRIDDVPGNAAPDALALAADRYPKLRQQAFIDRLMITAVSALAHEKKRWESPRLSGHDRVARKLQDALTPDPWAKG